MSRARLVWPFTAVLTMLVGISVYQSYRADECRSLTWGELPIVKEYRQADHRYQQETNSADGGLLSRIAARHAIIEQLRAGQISLFQAAAEFKRLNSKPNPCLYKFVATLPGDSDNEKVCQQVICWLLAETQEMPPSQRGALLDRVEAELRDHRECNGTVILPEN